MSTLQYAFLSLVMLTVALEAKEILRAQEGVPTTGRFIVSLDLDTPTERFEDLAAKIELEAGDQNIHKVDGHYTKIITAKLSEESLEKIKDEANVRYIEEEIIITAEEPVPSQTVPSQAIPWHLDRIDQRDLPLDGSFSFEQTGAGVDIYIVDTGIRLTHNEFGGRARYPGRDPMDDFSGFIQEGQDCNGHGTHVAALAGGATYGVARGANLYSVRVLDCAGNGPQAVVADGINYAAQQIRDSGRRGVINLSLGVRWPAIIRSWNDAVEAAVADGIPVMVAAGNYNRDACGDSPASAAHAVTVGATTNADERSDFSNWGPCVDIFAPGSDITSASHLSDDGTFVDSGTSMATPIVSGVAATMLERDNTLTPDQLFRLLIQFAVPDTLTNIGAGSFNDFLFSVFIEVCWFDLQNYGGDKFCTRGIRNIFYHRINVDGFNDRFSSVKVPSGFQVVGFTDSSLDGEARVYTGNSVDLGELDNAISSYSLTEPQPCFFEDRDYGGNVICSSTRLDGRALDARGLNNKISSLKVPVGKRAYCQDSFNYSTGQCYGRTMPWHDTDVSYVGDSMNDIISCISITDS